MYYDQANFQSPGTNEIK